MSETERIKEIIEKEFRCEMELKLFHGVSRLEHIKKQIFWKIDNPNFIKKEI